MSLRWCCCALCRCAMSVVKGEPPLPARRRGVSTASITPVAMKMDASPSSLGNTGKGWWSSCSASFVSVIHLLALARQTRNLLIVPSGTPSSAFLEPEPGCGEIIDARYAALFVWEPCRMVHLQQCPAKLMLLASTEMMKTEIHGEGTGKGTSIQCLPAVRCYIHYG